MQTFYKDYICWRESFLGYTNKAYISALNNFFKFLQYKNINNLQQINQKIILEWLSQNKQWAPFTKRMSLSHINCFFKYLQRTATVKSNPTEGIKLKVTKYIPYIYSIKEISDLLNVARKYGSDYEGLTFYTMFYTIYALGLRLNEALNIRLKDINLEDKSIFIYKTKFGKERLLPFSENTKLKLEQFLLLRLKQYPPLNDEEPLFCNRCHIVHSKCYIEREFRKLTKLAGLTTNVAGNLPRIHDLRHAAATHLLYKWYNEGKDVLNKLPYLSIYLGHVDISSTEYYLSISNALLGEANKRFKGKFGNKL